jgi:hypothetical protein
MSDIDVIGMIAEFDKLLTQERLKIGFPIGTTARLHYQGLTTFMRQRMSALGSPDPKLVIPESLWPQIALLAEQDYAEWEQSDARTYALLDAAFRETSFKPAADTLNVVVGSTLITVLFGKLVSLGSKIVKLADIGTGEGTTTLSVISAIRRRFGAAAAALLEKVHFTLIDLSEQRLEISKKRLINEGIPNENIDLLISSAESVLGNPPSAFDAIYSNATIHHFSFPSIWSKIYESLNSPGVVVVGDFHTPAWQYPRTFALLLEVMGADANAISDFRRFFGVPSDKGLSLGLLSLRDHRSVLSAIRRRSGVFGFMVMELGLDTGECISVHQTFEYAKAIVDQLRIMRSSMGDIPVNSPLEGTGTSRQMIGAMENAGFVMDVSKIKEVFKCGLHGVSQQVVYFGGEPSDVARVTVGIKLPADLSRNGKRKRLPTGRIKTG